MKSGLPGTPEEQKRLLREAMDKNAETLRGLAGIVAKSSRVAATLPL